MHQEPTCTRVSSHHLLHSLLRTSQPKGEAERHKQIRFPRASLASSLTIQKSALVISPAITTAAGGRQTMATGHSTTLQPPCLLQTCCFILTQKGFFFIFPLLHHCSPRLDRCCKSYTGLCRMGPPNPARKAPCLRKELQGEALARQLPGSAGQGSCLCWQTPPPFVSACYNHPRPGTAPRAALRHQEQSHENR